MRVLIVGAGGFIGRHLAGRLVVDGVHVIAAGRSPARLARAIPGVDAIACDLASDRAADWAPRLAGIDAVVNCAGLFGDAAGYAGVHARGAIALFDAAAAQEVGRAIQVSALGAGARGSTAYARSKGSADDHLATINPSGTAMGWAVVRPSLVVGRGGRSFALFAALASLPVTPRLGRAAGLVQPIAIDDLIECIVRLLRAPLPLALTVDAVGPETMVTDMLVLTLRRWLGLRPAPGAVVPRFLLGLVARVGIGPLTGEALALLAAGNTACAEPLVAATGHRPAPIAQALARTPATDADLRQARLASLAPLLRAALAFVWLAGGIVPLAATPAAVDAAWLAKAGLFAAAGSAALWSGALADVAVGLALVARIHGAALAGVALMAAYTLILSLVAPELWADPFGALVKNVAVLALSLAVHAGEVRRG